MSRTVRTVRTVFRALAGAVRVAQSLCRSVLGDTPVRLLALLVVAAVAGLMLVAAWDGLWSRLPWSAERRLDRAEAELADARSSLRARQIEAEARARQATAVDDAHHTLTQARAATARAIAQSEGAPDADQPLDPDRLARLRAHDRRLCDLSPALCRPADGRSPEPVQ
ncbi:hypothetical protein [Brevundimonas sp.]|uniref:hypothetical protein n=1 Tax=Brevundimonas sp. TaxID=1871086 RepID=UPI0025DDF1B9|nr:hypothetical protein [Brevundimonas sp.]